VHSHLIHRSLGACLFVRQRYIDWFVHFCTATRHFIPQMSYAIQCFSMGQKCSFYRGSGPQSIDCFLNPHGPHPKLVQIRLNRFCKACVHDQRQRDSQTTLPHEVCRNSPRLSSVLQATRAINKSTFTNHLTYLLTYLLT